MSHGEARVIDKMEGRAVIEPQYARKDDEMAVRDRAQPVEGSGEVGGLADRAIARDPGQLESNGLKPATARRRCEGTPSLGHGPPESGIRGPIGATTGDYTDATS